MNNLQVFKNNEFGEIRTLVDNEKQPWFNAKDVCSVLKYGNNSEALRKHVDNEDITKCDTPTNSGIQNMNYINESGLYSLIFGSKLKEAKLFKRWVTKEVLPSIRKTGNYSIKNNIFNLELEKRTVMLETMTFREINDYVCKLEKQLNNFIKLKEIMKTIEIY